MHHTLNLCRARKQNNNLILNEKEKLENLEKNLKIKLNVLSESIVEKTNKNLERKDYLSVCSNDLKKVISETLSRNKVI